MGYRVLNYKRGFDGLKIYISGPMSGLPDHNYPAFFAAAEEIREQGHEPVNPAEGAPGGWTWAQYMRRDLMLLLTADAVFVLPGWEHSRGARLECVIAHQLKMPVHYLKSRRRLTYEQT